MPSSLPSDLDTKNNEKINLSMEANLDCELYRVYSLKKKHKIFLTASSISHYFALAINISPGHSYK